MEPMPIRWSTDEPTLAEGRLFARGIIGNDIDALAELIEIRSGGALTASEFLRATLTQSHIWMNEMREAYVEGAKPFNDWCEATMEAQAAQAKRKQRAMRELDEGAARKGDGIPPAFRTMFDDAS